MKSRPVLLALLLAFFGCAEDDAPPPSSTSLVGVPTVDLGAVADAPRLTWSVAPEPLLQIGADEGIDSELFGDVSALAVLRDGSFVVADALAGTVRTFAADGAELEEVAGPGDGPGDVRSPTSLLLLPGDSLLVWDSRHWRTSLFDSEGDFVRADPYDPTLPGSYPMLGMWPERVEVAGGGDHLVHLASKVGFEPADWSGGVPAGIAVHDRGAAAPRLLATFPAPARVVVEAPWGSMALPAPLAGGPVAAADALNGWVCAGHQDRPELVCDDPTGVRVGVRWSDHTRALHDPGTVLEEWRADMLSFLSGKVSESELSSMTAHIRAPDAHPSFSSLTFDSGGRLWIALGPTDEASVTEYLVLDGRLEALGRVVLPRLDHLRVVKDRVVGVRTNRLGVDEVVAFRLDR